MLKQVKLVPIAIFVTLLALAVRPAQAEKWYHSTEAWTIYGLTAGLLLDDIFDHDRDDYKCYRYDPRPARVSYYDDYYRDYNTHYRHRPHRSTWSSYYGPYDNDYSYGGQYDRAEPRTQRPVYNTPTYTERRQTRVWPVYRSSEEIRIPISQREPSSPQAVSLADRAQGDTTVIVINAKDGETSVDVQESPAASEEKAVETSAVTRDRSVRPVRYVRRSNSAGAEFREQARDRRQANSRYVVIEVPDASENRPARVVDTLDVPAGKETPTDEKAVDPETERTAPNDG